MLVSAFQLGHTRAGQSRIAERPLVAELRLTRCRAPGLLSRSRRFDGSWLLRPDFSIMKIRRAKPTDANQLLEIYRPVVENTAISFELTLPSEDDFAARIASSIVSHDWFVMEGTSGLCGYAYATPHRAREAYEHSVETSVYVDTNYRGQGVGKGLYQALFSSLASLGYHNAYAGITLPNEPSVALHKSLGFEPIGVFREIGYKFGRWHDVSWWQRGINS